MDHYKVKPESIIKDKPPKDSTPYRKLTAEFAKQLRHLSAGDLAELRRISSDAPFTPTLWRILLSGDIGETDGYVSQAEWERRWAILLMALAHTVDLHSGDIKMGEALAKAGWSELRFVQLMRARGKQLETQIRRLAQFLASKSQPADWSDITMLLFVQNGKWADEIRIAISRSYYSTLYNQEQDK